MNPVKAFVGANRRAARALERRWPRFFLGDHDYLACLRQRVEADIASNAPQVVLEPGGIDRPFLEKGRGFRYIGVDIEERPDCYRVYDAFHVQSIEERLPVKVDMVVSTTLLEHVPDNRRSIATIHDALNPGGTTHHYIPSKNHPYALALRLVGPRLQKILIAWLRPEAAAVTGYPTFFSHCTPGQMHALFQETGFSSIDIQPFYRAADYFAFFLPTYLACVLFENACKALDMRAFASGFVISAKVAGTTQAQVSR